jgi:S-adenosylmethionine synthetase
MPIVVESLMRTPIEQQKVEIVERKGVGHPDSLADGMAESVSQALCRDYIRRYGTVLHHNTDKLEVVGGEVNVGFGGGEIIRPIYVLLSGRATNRAGDEDIPVHEIALKAARRYMHGVLPNLEQDDVVFESKIGHGSAELVDVFRRTGSLPSANDTSVGVGYAPLSETERLVLGVEGLLNSERFKKRIPELGEDIKVMGLRQNDTITLTVAGAFVAKYVPDMDHYISVRDQIVSEIEDYLSDNAERETAVHMNAADDIDKGVVYLTLTGTSAEAGDDGEVGRGNRVNGLITPNREMSLEAAAGKNPVNHVGKLYNILATRASQAIHASAGCEVYVKILSQIGRPIDDPLMASVELVGDCRSSNSEIEAIMQEHLSGLSKLTDEIIKGSVPVF